MPRYVTLKELFSEMVTRQGMNVDKDVMAYLQGARYLLGQEKQSNEIRNTLNKPANRERAGELFVYDLQTSKADLDAFPHHTFLIGLQLLLTEIDDGFEMKKLDEAVSKFPQAYQKALERAGKDEAPEENQEVRNLYTITPPEKPSETPAE